MRHRPPRVPGRGRGRLKKLRRSSWKPGREGARRRRGDAHAPRRTRRIVLQWPGHANPARARARAPRRAHRRLLVVGHRRDEGDLLVLERRGRQRAARGRRRPPRDGPRPGRVRARHADAPRGPPARLLGERRHPGPLPRHHEAQRRARVHLRAPRRHHRFEGQPFLERDRRLLRLRREQGRRLGLPERPHRRDRGQAHGRSEARLPHRPFEWRLHVAPHGLRSRQSDRRHREPRRRDVARPIQVQAEPAGQRPRGARHQGRRGPLRRPGRRRRRHAQGYPGAVTTVADWATNDGCSATLD